ncbi:hypothetical protein [Pollutibacter soli]|uniref:hypothetical protein n=1 Tax=Pollutibacter soli TaxID=3034157 RepID=UPI0030135052
MRTLLFCILLLAATSTRAQRFIPSPIVGYTPIGMGGAQQLMYREIPDKKWFVTSNVGITTGFSTWKGGSAGYVAAPVSLQLNRRLTDNLYAYGAITAAPTYMNFNGAFMGANAGKYQPTGFMRNGSFNMYSRAEMGLYYINDSKTFSISGSISVEHGGHPMMPYYYAPQNKQQPAAQNNR